MRSALLAIVACLAVPAGATAQFGPASGPRTGFEERSGASWTTHEEELAFLEAVGSASSRVRLSLAGTTKQGRRLHLVQLGTPSPPPRAAAAARPTVLIVCTQHGNEPSGREACLSRLRDLAFSVDPGVVDLLATTTFLFVPTANPDGRAANTRGNSDGIDINRDHLTLDTAEARAIAAIVRDWQPDVVLDLHEYGPSVPVLYDDSVLWLWPRNLNVDQHVHDMAVELGEDYLVPAAKGAGYTTDEYGQYEVVDNDIAQTAGDGDEGILRNTMGLRHALGILVETRVDADPRQNVVELADTAALQSRRVASHLAVLDGLARFMHERGAAARTTSSHAAERKREEGARGDVPVYFGGADNTAPTAAQTVAAPCGYRLGDDDTVALGPRLDLLSIESHRLAGGPFVSLAQRAEPLIPLLLDERGARHVASAEALSRCPKVPVTCTRTVTVRIPRGRGRVRSVTVRGAGRTVRKRGARSRVRIRLSGRDGRRVKVAITVRGSRGTVRRAVRYRISC